MTTSNSGASMESKPTHTPANMHDSDTGSQPLRNDSDVEKPRFATQHEDAESAASSDPPLGVLGGDTGVDSCSDARTAAHRALVFKQDVRIVPLCATIYLLCYLDRSNIGNAKVLNENTGNDVSGLVCLDYLAESSPAASYSQKRA
jgi:hypothetical protein